ncbi:MAG: hypothetical protein HRU75_09280 [Planctomycetia bacterium]|nr:MAG: hypothetical protein HRU75_09280 [Planctomycetia bacterium]
MLLPGQHVVIDNIALPVGLFLPVINRTPRPLHLCVVIAIIALSVSLLLPGLTPPPRA